MNRATTAEFLPSSVSAETGLMRAIDHACVQSSPFPHVFIRDVFPKSYYELMRRNFPKPALLISNGEAGRGNNLQARFVFELKPNYLQTSLTSSDNSGATLQTGFSATGSDGSLSENSVTALRVDLAAWSMFNSGATPYWSKIRRPTAWVLIPTIRAKPLLCCFIFPAMNPK